MRAVFFEEHGGPEVLQVGQYPDPKAQPGEVVIRVAYCALNHLDIWVRNGLPGVEIPKPHILGSDIAGIVESLGEGVTHVELGERVMVMPGLSCGHCPACRQGQDHLCDHFDILGQRRDGGYAEKVAVPAPQVLRLPPQVTFKEAAAFPVTFQTAWHLLFSLAHLAPRDTILIHSAGSGLGSAALQLARLKKARVICTVGSPWKKERALSLGAERVVDLTQESLLPVLSEWTQGRGVQVVLDSVGSATFPESLQALGKQGRLLVCGTTTGSDVSFSLRPFFTKNLSLLGARLGSSGALREAFGWLVRGKLSPVVDSIFSLEQAVEAQNKMERREVFGKILLKVSGQE